MDWDEIAPKKPKTNAAVGDNLSTLSVAELPPSVSSVDPRLLR